MPRQPIYRGLHKGDATPRGVPNRLTRRANSVPTELTPDLAAIDRQANSGCKILLHVSAIELSPDVLPKLRYLQAFNELPESGFVARV